MLTVLMWVSCTKVLHVRCDKKCFTEIVKYIQSNGMNILFYLKVSCK